MTATPATIELTDLVLRDSAHVQQADADLAQVAPPEKLVAHVPPMFSRSP